MLFVRGNAAFEPVTDIPDNLRDTRPGILPDSYPGRATPPPQVLDVDTDIRDPLD